MNIVWYNIHIYFKYYHLYSLIIYPSMKWLNTKHTDVVFQVSGPTIIIIMYHFHEGAYISKSNR